RLMFIGYTLTSKQYRLYDPKAKKIIVSRDVVFHEDTSYCQPVDQNIFISFTTDSNTKPPSFNQHSPATINSVPTTPTISVQASMEQDKARTQKKRAEKELRSSLGPYWNITER